MTASVGVSCNPLWLVATISSNVKFLLNFITFIVNFFSTDSADSSDFRFELKKTSKTPLVMAEVYRPGVLSFRSVLNSELLHSP